MDVMLLDRLPEDIRSAVVDGGGTTHYICPKCQGGRTSERSLSVRSVEPGVVKLSCWRASCGWYALTITEPGAKIHSKQLKPGNVFRDPIEPVHGFVLDVLKCDYGLMEYHILRHGWGIGPEGQLVMSVRNPFGLEIGHTTRTFGKTKRCMTYKATSEVWADWWVHRDDDDQPPRKLIIVEDQLSACRVYGAGYDAVALLGTNMSTEMAQQLAQFCPDRNQVYLALDRDAYLKALKLTSRHAHILKLRPVCLDRDLKDEPTDTAIHELFGVKNDRRDSTGCSRMQQSGGV